ncbi:MAG: heavy metal-responsive transcriptional regulator [Nitrospinota bacterium]
MRQPLYIYIGKVAKQVGLNPRTIRYYETLGLLPPPLRSESRYRLYTQQAVELLHFIKKAKTLGFTLTEIREIIALRQRGDLPCPHVHALLTERVQTLTRQIRDLTLLRNELTGLARKSTNPPRTRAHASSVCPHIERAQIQPRPLRSNPRQKSS